MSSSGRFVAMRRGDTDDDGCRVALADPGDGEAAVVSLVRLDELLRAAPASMAPARGGEVPTAAPDEGRTATADPPLLTAARAPTVLGAARTAAIGTVGGIDSNGMHDLMVGAIAEAFLSGHWDVRIQEADREIAAAARQVRDASSAADQAAINEQLAQQQRANELLRAQDELLRAANLEYQTAVLALASAANRAVGGAGGRRMQGSIAALLPVQARLARLAELEQLARVPSYSDASGYALAVLAAGELGPTRQTDQFVRLISRLLYIRERFLAREVAAWRERERALSGLVSSVAPDDTSAGR